MSTPDITGFFAAQDRLRELTGVDATFRVPTPKVWPAGTQLDRETGEPYDPTVVPVSGGEPTEVVVRCSILTQLVSSNLTNATEATQAGVFRGESVALGLAEERHAEVKDATEVVVAGVEYRVTEIVPDPAFNNVQRYVAFGEAT